MPGGKRKLQTWPVVVACVLLCGFVPAKVAADSSASLRSRATELRHENTRLAARSHGTVLELYALDAQLARARAHVVALRIEAAQVRAERAASERRLTIARRSLKAAQRALELRVQQLYEQGDDDPVAVLLGSTSVSEAFNKLDTIGRISDVDRLVLAQTRDARQRYQRETRDPRGPAALAHGPARRSVADRKRARADACPARRLSRLARNQAEHERLVDLRTREPGAGGRSAREPDRPGAPQRAEAARSRRARR